MTTAPSTPGIDLERARAIVAEARAAYRTTLLEPEAREILEAIGIAVPRAAFVPVNARGEVDPGEVDRAIAGLDGDRVVVRVVAPSVVHKTEVGGVAVIAREAAPVRATIEAMQTRLGAAGIVDVDGFMIAQHVAHDPGLGGELLASVRWTPDAGPVVSVGVGGTEAEAIAADLVPGREIAILSPALTPAGAEPTVLRAATAVRLATTSQRGRPARLPMDTLLDAVRRLLAFADACVPDDLEELEINPLVVADGRLVALDVLASIGVGEAGTSRHRTPAGRTVAHPRPVAKLSKLLEPASIAIIGVSASMNPGHVILRNLLRDGFSADRITVVKPGAESIDGCRCVPDLASLPARVDLFVVAVSAAQAAEVVTTVIERHAAETILVIPGGLEEKRGSEAIVARMRAALETSRSRRDGGPLLNGGNCLGFRSVPGRIDTMFIPATKLAAPAEPTAPMALIAQSGAFAIARLGRLPDLHPRYLITVGNQMDLTVGDHVAHLADDPSIRVFGVYVEGFRPLDARRTLEASARIRARGGTVVLYHAGRTAAGATASASHTASIASDVTVVRALARQVGVLVADTLEDFDDLVRTATLLAGRAIEGRRLGAISNAGFECVAIGDNLGSLSLAELDGPTRGHLGELLAGAGAGSVVDVHNPIDATPMADDAVFAGLTETIFAAPGVDVGAVGIVPLTAALRTLPAGRGHDEDLAAPDAVAARLVELWARTSLAWVAIVDGGARYEPFIVALEAGGIPVFRTADRAMRALDAVVRHRLDAPA